MVSGLTVTNGGRVYLGNTSNAGVTSNIKFWRCDIYYLTLGFPNYSPIIADSILITECVINNLQLDQATNVEVYSSFIADLNYGSTSTLIQNCVITNRGSQIAVSDFMDGVIFRDNIFLESSSVNLADGAIYQNNLFAFNSGSIGAIDPTVTYAPSNQETQTPLSNLFVNVTSYNMFSYFENYRLKPNGTQFSNFSTMGSTGGAVGVYFGNNTMDWKVGSVPFNPHWKKINVPAQSTGSQLTPVSIGASSQPR